MTASLLSRARRPPLQAVKASVPSAPPAQQQALSLRQTQARYQKRTGDQTYRADAQAYGRQLGIPELQLDWTE